MQSPILFLLTGGTIDSYSDGTKDTVVPHETSILPRYINSLKLYDALEFKEICMKDSRQMTRADRELILENLETTACTKIIITHGTYTMTDTAKFLDTNLQRRDQTIILTGAMIPHVIPNSDGPFNLGYSLAEVKQRDSGVYICMHGRIFGPTEATKDINDGRFIFTFTS